MADLRKALSNASNPGVAFAGRARAGDVVDEPTGGEQAREPIAPERHDLAVLHSEHHRLEAFLWQLIDDAYGVFVQRVLAVGNRIEHHHMEEAAKLAHQVSDLGVARVGEFSLKVKPMTNTLASCIFSLR